MSMKSLFFSQLSRELSWAAVPVESVTAEYNDRDNPVTIYKVNIKREKLPDNGKAVSDIKVRLWIGEDILTTENHEFILEESISTENKQTIMIPIEVGGRDLSDKEIHSAEAWILWKR